MLRNSGLGLDPGLGVLHLDAVGRDSLALDVLEPLRPEVDRFVLAMVAERSFTKSSFAERSDGHVRVAGPLAHELAATMPTWRRAVAPWAEKVAHVLTDQVAGKITSTTPLTRSRAVAAQAEVRRRKAIDAMAQAESAHAEYRAARPTRRVAAPRPGQAAVALATCVDCGGPLTRSRHVRCEGCWDAIPAQSREVRRRRGRSIATARSEIDAWRADHPHAHARPEDFADIRAGLATVTLAKIMAACGVSKSTASGWRTGRTVPALARWEALAQLAGVDLPEGIHGVAGPPGPPATATPVRTDAQARAIAHARQERAVARAALVAEVDAAIAAVGWHQARPLVVSVLGEHVPVSGPHGRWRHLLRKRNGAQLLGLLDQLPAQGALAVSCGPSRLTRPSRSVVTTTMEVPS